jgi:hypothetical protein
VNSSSTKSANLPVDLQVVFHTNSCCFPNLVINTSCDLGMKSRIINYPFVSVFEKMTKRETPHSCLQSLGNIWQTFQVFENAGIHGNLQTISSFGTLISKEISSTSHTAEDIPSSNVVEYPISSPVICNEVLDSVLRSSEHITNKYIEIPTKCTKKSIEEKLKKTFGDDYKYEVLVLPEGAQPLTPSSIATHYTASTFATVDSIALDKISRSSVLSVLDVDKNEELGEKFNYSVCSRDESDVKKKCNYEKGLTRHSLGSGNEKNLRQFKGKGKFQTRHSVAMVEINSLRVHYPDFYSLSAKEHLKNNNENKKCRVNCGEVLDDFCVMSESYDDVEKCSSTVMKNDDDAKTLILASCQDKYEEVYEEENYSVKSSYHYEEDDFFKRNKENQDSWEEEERQLFPLEKLNLFSSNSSRLILPSSPSDERSPPQLSPFRSPQLSPFRSTSTNITPPSFSVTIPHSSLPVLQTSITPLQNYDELEEPFLSSGFYYPTDASSPKQSFNNNKREKCRKSPEKYSKKWKDCDLIYNKTYNNKFNKNEVNKNKETSDNKNFVEKEVNYILVEPAVTPDKKLIEWMDNENVFKQACFSNCNKNLISKEPPSDDSNFSTNLLISNKIDTKKELDKEGKLQIYPSQQSAFFFSPKKDRCVQNSNLNTVKHTSLPNTNFLYTQNSSHCLIDIENKPLDQERLEHLKVTLNTENELSLHKSQKNLLHDYPSEKSTSLISDISSVSVCDEIENNYKWKNKLNEQGLLFCNGQPGPVPTPPFFPSPTHSREGVYGNVVKNYPNSEKNTNIMISHSQKSSSSSLSSFSSPSFSSPLLSSSNPLHDDLDNFLNHRKENCSPSQLLLPKTNDLIDSNTLSSEPHWRLVKQTFQFVDEKSDKMMIIKEFFNYKRKIK